jgi:hypothetical protein
VTRLIHLVHSIVSHMLQIYISYVHISPLSSHHVHCHLDRLIILIILIIHIKAIIHITRARNVITSYNNHRDIYRSAPLGSQQRKRPTLSKSRGTAHPYSSALPNKIAESKLQTYMLSSNSLECLDGFREGICRIPSKRI